jgi:hypothetical protein
MNEGSDEFGAAVPITMLNRAHGPATGKHRAGAKRPFRTTGTQLEAYNVTFRAEPQPEVA